MDRQPGWAHDRYGISRGNPRLSRDSMFAAPAAAAPSPGMFEIDAADPSTEMQGPVLQGRTPGWAHEAYGLDRGIPSRQERNAGMEAKEAARQAQKAAENDPRLAEGYDVVGGFVDAADTVGAGLKSAAGTITDGVADAARWAMHYPGVQESQKRERWGMPGYGPTTSPASVGQPDIQAPPMESMFAADDTQMRPLGPEPTLRPLAPDTTQLRPLSGEGGPAPAQQPGAARPKPKAQAPRSMMAPVEQPPAAQPQPVERAAAAQQPNNQNEYLATLKEALKDDGEETPQERSRRLQRSVFMGGMAMMAAAGKPYATFGGSLGEGGMAGARESERIENDRTGRKDKKRANAVEFAKAGYQVGRDTSSDARADRSIGIQEENAAGLKSSRGETERHNRAEEGLGRERIDKGPQSSMRDQKAVLGETFDEANERGAGETPEQFKRRRARWVSQALTQRKSAGGLSDRLATARSLSQRDPMFSLKDPAEQDQMIDEEIQRGSGGGFDDEDAGAPAPAATPAHKGPPVGTRRGDLEFKGGDPRNPKSWAKWN